MAPKRMWLPQKGDTVRYNLMPLSRKTRHYIWGIVLSAAVGEVTIQTQQGQTFSAHSTMFSPLVMVAL